MDNIEKLDRQLCTGCGLCYNVCPYNAIEMRTNKEGFLYPYVNLNCINCGLCYNACPQIKPSNNFNKVLESYAVLCKDEIRSQCSSGGFFGAAAYYAISQGGAVIGAGYDNNFRHVSHQMAKDKSHLINLFKSKYVQSDMGNIYKTIKNQLQHSSKPVVFCGCPCQVDALKVYLGKDYNNLYCIDILCRGVPSPLAYKKFLDEVAGNKTITNVDFRDKKSGWGTLLSIKFVDGTTHYDLYNGNYFRAFLSGLAMREACYHCKYAQGQRVGDITIGDFWNIGEYKKELNDNGGTSMVLCNTAKGIRLMNMLKANFQLQEYIDWDTVVNISRKVNWAIIKPSPEPQMRKCFFHHLSKDSFSKSLRYAEKALIDVGILGWWIQTDHSNYGSTLTCYALYQYILSLGLSVAFVSPPNFDRENAGEFNKKHGYRMTMKRSYKEMSENNKYIDTFLVGSDVLWYYDAFIQTQYFFMLDFVNDDKRKISYGTSFGNTEIFFPDKEILKVRSLLKRFDKVSVREFEAVDICRDKFSVSATQVLDPVFLCDKSHWVKMAESANRKTQGKFLFSYLLDPNEEKAELLRYTARKLGLQLVTVTDNQFNHEQKENILRNYGLISNATIEEVIYHLLNAKFIISDSYHGICFSLIFNKQFIAITSRIRNDARFATLSKLFNINDRLLYDFSTILERKDLLDKKINYNILNKLIEKETNRSAEWLKEALFAPKTKIKKTETDYIVDEILEMKKLILDMQQYIEIIKENNNK